MRGRNPIGFRPRFLWSGVGVPDFIIFDIVLNRLRLGKLGTSAPIFCRLSLSLRRWEAVRQSLRASPHDCSHLSLSLQSIMGSDSFLRMEIRSAVILGSGSKDSGRAAGIPPEMRGLPARCDKWKNDALFYRIEIQRRSLLRLAAAARYAVGTADDRRGNLYPAP